MNATKNPLHKELSFYKENQQNLVKEYQGKFIVIKNQKVVGAYDTKIDAYTDAQKKFELGTFLIQSVEPGEESYSQTFYSRVSV